MVPLEPEGQIVTFFGGLHRSWVGLIRTGHGSEATACLSVIPFRARIDFPVVVLAVPYLLHTVIFGTESKLDTAALAVAVSGGFARSLELVGPPGEAIGRVTDHLLGIGLLYNPTNNQARQPVRIHAP